jgi:DNA-binding CsgD family transcriptional regulator
VARLRRVDCSGPGIERRGRGRGFQYLENGERIDDAEVLERIRELVIPPAWKDVWICPYPMGHIQAVGTDAAGRRQYIYHQRWRERRDQEKFDEMIRFARALPRVRKIAARNLHQKEATRERVLAGAVRLLDGRGLIVLAPDGRIEFASPSARRLMRENFGVPPEGELPPALARWLDSGSPTLTRRVAGCRLTVNRSGDTLLLEELRDELGLTPRERQILAWVARGKTNPEIAEILWIAPTTVRRHLENIYAKLGVHTRTAAATRLLGVLDDEERQRRTPA